MAVGRVSSMVGEKVVEARKAMCSGAFARGLVLKFLDDLRQARLLCLTAAFAFQRYDAPWFRTDRIG